MEQRHEINLRCRTASSRDDDDDIGCMYGPLHIVDGMCIMT